MQTATDSVFLYYYTLSKAGYIARTEYADKRASNFQEKSVKNFPLFFIMTQCRSDIAPERNDDMNTPTQNKTNVSQTMNPPASCSRRVLCGRALNLAAALLVGTFRLSGSTSRYAECDGDDKQRQDAIWNTEWEEIPF